MIRSLPSVVCAVFLLSAHAAAAKPRVAILRIEGDASGEVREAVSEALGGKELTLVASKEVNRAAEKVGEPADYTELEFRTLASELAADAVIAGKLDKAGATKTLKFRLFIRKQMAKGFTVSFKDPASEKFRTLLHDKVLDRFATAGLGEGGEAAEARPPRNAAPDAEVRPVKKAKPDDDRPVKKAKPDDEDAADAAEPEPAPARPGKVAAAAVETRAEPRAAAARTPPAPIARVALGASLVDRSYTFEASNIVGKPNNYAGSAPGVRFEAEVYPTAYTNPSGALANLGVAIAYDRSFGLTAPTLTAGTTVPVKQSSYAIGLRYRWAIGAAATPPTLTFGLGFAKRLFSPDRSGLTDPAVIDSVLRDSPNTNYSLVDPGATFRMPVTARIAVALGVEGLIVLDAGGIQSNSSYGQATVFGVQGLAAVEIQVTRRFVVRLAGEFSQIGYAFTGIGARSGNVDGDPTTKDVSGLTDRAIGGSATLGVVY